ncbi:WD repeat-containing protein 36 [Pseudolycoriella hygida]|uniref:WD repeat-containing protein 36 n=1 Tax=Pseudolycoriella hygida TaxID=35572 RepID=A0A9Q0RZV4_9DIPT|nr:WD repeat-containing protein 36 [Pseudolycoriella hygida]
MSGSRLFRRNRALGFVTNHVPACIRYIRRRKENVIVTCIGRLFHTYSCNHFRLVCVSGIHPEDITCIASDNYCVYAASAKNIYAWRSGNVIKHMYKGHRSNVHIMLPFGAHLISIDEDSNLKIWNIKMGDEFLDLPFRNEDFKITAVMHPPTYLNKILLGSEQGGLQLWNINDGRLVYNFERFDSKITCLEAAPAVDVAAIGMLSGRIVLLNLKYGEQIMEFNQEWGAVTGIAFRTDGQSIMATSSTNGKIVFWNLDEMKVSSQLVAHHKSVTTLKCLSNEPLVFTTSPDNTMKLWIFDMPDGGARLLRIREGHSAPPQFISYHGVDGQNILSAGEDSSLRIFNTMTESFNKSMGRASYNRKSSKRKTKFEEDSLLMPPITYFASEVTRDKEWDSIAAVHRGLVMTTTWSFNKCRMGDLKIVPEKFQNKNRTDFEAEAVCLCITHCGNFVVIGYSSGDVERFNMQSGIHRGTYGKPAHTSAIRGVQCDNLNQYVITGGGDGFVKFWNFKEQTLCGKLNMNDGIRMFRMHRESAMLCVVLDEFNVVIVDCDTKVNVRKFEGHTGPITDACFSPDGRWLVTASMDCTIKVWDITSSYMIDHFKLEKHCISLTLSPTGDFLATAHVNYLGLFLWANKTLFSHVTLRSIDPHSEAPLVELPLNVASENNAKLPEIGDLSLDGEKLETEYDSPKQLDDLVTLSTVSTSKWQNLLDLDLVKKRNKPKAPPKKPKQAPFFLPTVAGLDLKFDVPKVANDGTRILQVEYFSNLTIFGKKLDDSIESGNSQECADYLSNLGPSMIDFEIKSLHPEGGGSIAVMLQFMKMVEFMINTNLNFELAQTFFGVFLNCHGRTLATQTELKEQLVQLQRAQAKGWSSLGENLLYGGGVVACLRNFAN